MNDALTRLTSWLSPLRGRLMAVFVMIVGLYFVLSFGEQAWTARQLEDDVAERQSEIAELRDRRDGLERQVEAFNTDQYHTFVEQSARRDLNLAYPGETVLLVRWAEAEIADEPREPESGDSEPGSNWERWLELLTSRS